jgi:hypothetical protein
MAASALKIPELRLSERDSKELSVASMNVLRHYSPTILSEKSQDWIKFGMVASMIYVPRASAASARAKAARAAKAAKANQTGGIKMPEPPPETVSESAPEFQPDGSETIQ